MPRKPTTNNGFRLTADDEAILEYVFKCRLATVDHISRLTGRSSKKISTRLLRLAQNGYLFKQELPFQKYIYSLGSEAVQPLVAQGVVDQKVIRTQLRLR